MKEHGLVFCPEMIEGLLSGRKTMTRRRLVIQPYRVRCPYAMGDLVYAKETVYIDPSTQDVQYQRPVFVGHTPRPRLPPGWHVYTSRYMPKAFARIWRTITDVRPPERVQDISYKDIIAEGWDVRRSEPWGDSATTGADARNWWHDLWVRLHGEESWQANVWVWPLVLGPCERR